MRKQERRREGRAPGADTGGWQAKIRRTKYLVSLDLRNDPGMAEGPEAVKTPGTRNMLEGCNWQERVLSLVLQNLPVVYTTIDNLKLKRLVNALGQGVVNPSIRRHLDASPVSRPILGRP